MKAFYEHTRPIRLRNSGPKFIPCGSRKNGDGWQQVFPSWEDVADWPNVGATPLKGYVIIDIDDKIKGTKKKRFTPTQRLNALKYIRNSSHTIVSHSRSRTHPDDPLHGHWLVRPSARAKVGRDDHPYGENIVPEKFGVFVRTERRPEPDIRSPWPEIALALRGIMVDAEKDPGDVGSINDLVYAWAIWLGEQGARKKDIKPLYGRKHKRTAERAWEEGKAKREGAAKAKADVPFWVDIHKEWEPMKTLLTMKMPITGIEHGAFPIGLSNVIVGDRGRGKSFLALWLASVAIADHGMKVLWMDREMGPRAWALKVQDFKSIHSALGRDKVLAYQHGGELELDDYPEALDESWLVIYDSVTAWGCPSDGANPTEWFSKYLNPLQDRGCTTLFIDHRSYTETRLQGKSMVGAGAKDQRIQGNIVGVERVSEFTPGKGGRLKLINEKNNCGALALGFGDTIGHVEVTPRFEWSFRPASGLETPKTEKAEQTPADVWEDFNRTLELRGVEYLTMGDFKLLMRFTQAKKGPMAAQMELAGMIRVTQVGQSKHVYPVPKKKWGDR